MSYKVNYTAKARKDLKNLPVDVAQRIILSINGIRDDPYAHVKKIKGTKRHPLYTHSACEYRAIMDITDDRLLIMVISEKKARLLTDMKKIEETAESAEL